MHRVRRCLVHATILQATRAMASNASCETRTVPFVLFGAGGVGSALLEAIVGARTLHAERYGVRFAALAVCDSSAAVSGAGQPSSTSCTQRLERNRRVRRPVIHRTNRHT